MDVLLQGEEDLVGVDGLDEIVGNLRPYGLVHDVFLLALGDHDNGCCRLYLLDVLQCFETAQARHHLVEKYQVEGLLPALVDGIGAVADGNDFVSFLLKEQNVGFEEFNLIVDP